MEDCDECLKPIKMGEKVIATCNGRRINQNRKLEINFFHINCFADDSSQTSLEDLIKNAMTVSAWKKKFQKEWH